VSSQVVKYRVGESTVVEFEIAPAPGYQPAGVEQVVGKVRDAVGPAVDAARDLLDKLKEARPDEVQVTFGIKVSGKATWLVAQAAADGNFSVTLTWRSPPTSVSTSSVADG
jgi:hypothetical protein